MIRTIGYGLLTLLGLVAQSQNQTSVELPEVIPPSPTVANLMRFEEVPIDHHTGQPNISIPLFSKQLAKGLPMDITLAYNTSGVRVDNVSGWVGTGWSLNVGGVISRTVRGLPDEKRKGDMGKGTGILHNPNFWNIDNLADSTLNEFYWNAIGTATERLDTEPDLYQFSFPGGSGRFVVALEEGVLRPKLISKEQLVKIEILDFNDTTLVVNAFRIIDPRGYQYVFSETEITESTPVSVSQDQRGHSSGISASGVLDIYRAVSAWHLTSIKSSDGQTTLATFEYQHSGEGYLVSRTVTRNEIINPGIVNDYLFNDYNLSILKPKLAVNYFSSSTGTRKPAKITFKDGVTVDFTLSRSIDPSYAHPETNGDYLSSISITSGFDATLTKQFVFDQAVINAPGNDLLSQKRLWLEGVSEIAGNDSLNYQFTYLNRSDLPAFGSSRDQWGYSDAYYTSATDPDPNTVLNGLLSKITYPTGGTKEFIFEPHTFSYGAGGVLTQAQLLKNADNTQSANHAMNLTGTYSTTGNSVPIYTSSVSFTHDQTIEVRSTLTGTFSSNQGIVGPNPGGDPDGLGSLFMELVDSLGNKVSSTLLDQDHQKISVSAGELTLNIISLTQGTLNLTGNVNMDYQSASTTINAHFLYGGGPRIREVLFQDALGTEPARRFTYTYTDAQDATRSSGAVDGILGSLSKEYEVGVNKYLFASIDNLSDAFGPTILRYKVNVEGTSNVLLSKGGYVGYRTVTVREIGNGASIYNFTTAQDYPNSLATFLHPFPPQANLDYKRGLLKSQEVYNEAGDILQQIVHDYTFTEDVITSSLVFQDPESCPWKQFYAEYSTYSGSNADHMPFCGGFPCIPNPQNCGENPGIFFLRDQMTFGWAKRDTTTTTAFVYDNGAATPLVTKEVFSYHPDNYQVVDYERIVRENGIDVSNRTRTFFSIDPLPPGHGFSASELLANEELKNLNRVTEPIRVENYEGAKLLSTVENGHEEVRAHQVELTNLRVAQGQNPLESRMDYHTYDEQGNILEVSKTNDVKTVYLWGYGKTVPVAKIINADHAVVAGLANQAILDNPTSESELLSELEAFRDHSALAHAQVYIYAYEPLRGIISQIDPTGNTTYYEYDDFHRLFQIKDRDENILQEFKYNYHNN